MAYSNNGHTAVISIRENEDRRFSPYVRIKLIVALGSFCNAVKDNLYRSRMGVYLASTTLKWPVSIFTGEGTMRRDLSTPLKG